MTVIVVLWVEVIGRRERGNFKPVAALGRMRGGRRVFREGFVGAGACLSRLEMAWHYVYLGDEAAARALLEPLRAAFSSPDSPVAAYFAQLEDVLTRSAEAGSFR